MKLDSKDSVGSTDSNILLLDMMFDQSFDCMHNAA